MTDRNKADRHVAFTMTRERLTVARFHRCVVCRRCQLFKKLIFAQPNADEELTNNLTRKFIIFRKDNFMRQSYYILVVISIVLKQIHSFTQWHN